MGANIDHFMNKFEEFKNLPSGESFSIEVTDKEATDAGWEYVTENKEWIKQQLKAATGMNLSVGNPTIKFGNDELSIDVTGAMGFIKANASLTAGVVWNGQPNVNVRAARPCWLRPTSSPSRC